MSGLLLRLAGPLQSWGEHSVFTDRDTAAYPTRSGLIGLIAAAQGRPRTAAIEDLHALVFTLRIDRPGVRLVDFHTIGGGLPRAQTTPTAEGKRRADGLATIVSRRHYLADAVFAAAVTGPDQLIKAVAAALRAPVWAPYLGRRSCPAEQPLLLAGPLPDPEAMLRTLPLARRSPAGGADTVTVDLLHQQPPASAAQPALARLERADLPLSFASTDRRYRSAPAYLTQISLPADLCAGHGDAYLQRLTTYLQGAPR
jgi:CRISPR system Cascade subunit CasD